MLDTSIGFFALISTAQLGGRDVLGNQLIAFSPFPSLRDKGAPTLPSPFAPSLHRPYHVHRELILTAVVVFLLENNGSFSS